MPTLAPTYRGVPTDQVAKAREVNWRFAFIVTGTLAAIGLCCVAILFWSPPSTIVGESLFPIYDKRWLLALFALAVGLAYCPAVTTRLIDCWHGCTMTPSNLQPRRIFALNIIGMIIVAVVAAVAAAASYQVAALTSPLNPHEIVHLGPIQAIHSGRIPYVEAESQYGIGFQVLSYRFMKAFDFSIFGFRAAHLTANFFADVVRFSVFLIAFGWRIGLTAVLLCFVFEPWWLTGLWGWGVLPRWLGAAVVGALLPLILWSDSHGLRRLAQVALLGASAGALAWFSHENFSTSLAAAGLTLTAAFTCGRLAFRDTVAAGATFAASLAATFLLCITATVGPAHLAQAVALNFYGTGIWLQGVASTPWSPESFWQWTAAFYVTPYLILALLVCALYAAPAADERKIGQLIGAAAAAAAMVPVTLLRSDPHHFVGPMSTALPVLIAAALFLLPNMLSGKRARQTIVSVFALALVSFAVPVAYWNDVVWARGAPWAMSVKRYEHAPASPYERRLGFTPVGANVVVPALWGPSDGPTFHEFRRIIEQIRHHVGTRSVMIENLPWATGTEKGVPWQASLIYFLGDLTVGTSQPEPWITQWVRADVERQRAELRRSPPECLITQAGSGYYLDLWRGTFEGDHTTTSFDGITIFCKAPAQRGAE